MIKDTKDAGQKLKGILPLAAIDRSHGEDRGGVHSGASVHLQDEVGGEDSSWAVPQPGDLPDRQQPEAGGAGEGAFRLSPTHPTGMAC